MKFFTIQTPLLDAAGDGGAGGGSQTDAGATGQQQTGTTQQTSSQSAGNQGTQQTTTQQTSSQQTGQAGSTTEFRYKEDRSDWVPRHRLNETSGKLKTIEEQNQDLQRRLTIALGVHPADPNQQKSDQVRQAFFQMFPQFKKLAELSDDQLEAVLQAPSHVSASREAELRQWQRHGDQQVDTVSQKVAEAIGTERLDDEQRSDLRDTFSSWIKQRARTELQQAADRYGDDAVAKNERRFSDTIRRYEDSDPKLLDEFVTRYTKNWVEPARRSATARTSTRTRAVPDGSGRTPVSSLQRPQKFNSLDERLDFAVKVAKERGVQFGS